MRDGIFITGASGFVGRHVLPELLALGRPVYALDRSGSLSSMRGTPGLQVVPGDLLDPSTFRDALESCAVVVHLAASTGRAAASHHQRVNVQGTEALLEQCRSAGVEKFLFVSSIATTFPAGIGYAYADAKRQAEGLVSRSGLRYTILRPTVIAGPGSPNLKSLEKLALLPVIVMPGTGLARVQPVDVSRVARVIIDTIAQDRFGNQVEEVGGPEVLTMEEHLRRIRRSRTGRDGAVLRVPLPLLRVPLRIAEAVGLVGLLPVTAGQLSSFRFDGVTDGHRLKADLATARECRVFTKYLLRARADAYAIDHYANAIATRGLSSSGAFDAWLIACARVTPLFTRLADSYATALVPTAVLRRRLVLLLAILETHPVLHEKVDKTVGGSGVLVFARLMWTMAAAVVTLLAGAVIFAPAHLLLALVEKEPR